MPSRRTCRRLATPLVTVLAVALAGCTSSPPPKSPTGAPGGTATAGGTLTVGVWQAPTTLLDAGITGQLDFGGAMAAPVEEGLLWYRSTTATATATSEADYWSPDLATSVPTVANGGVQTTGCADAAAKMCVTWHLRSGVRWDDGSDLTSHDVCDTFAFHWLDNGAAGKPSPLITLYETQPLASYGYTSINPNAPIFSGSTSPPDGLNAPYAGAPDPIGAMATDLHDAYEQAASDYMASNPTGSKVDVALAGDAWVSAINTRVVVRDPYLANNPSFEVDLWDSDPLDACCTTPIGYHPSIYGAYLSALVLFYEITQVNPESLLAEFDPADHRHRASAADALGISPDITWKLAFVASETVRLGHPI